MWSKIERGTAEKAMLIIMRESREQIEGEVRSLFSLLRIIACMSAGSEKEREREGERARASSEPQ